MAEIHFENYPGGYPRDPIAFRKDLYSLAAIFFASKGISSLHSEKENGPTIFATFREIELFEISRLLTSIAISCRHIVDNTEKYKSDENLDTSMVGALLVDNKESGLTFRTACNKIIHGDSISYEFENISDHNPRIKITSGNLAPRIYLYGSERSKED